MLDSGLNLKSQSKAMGIPQTGMNRPIGIIEARVAPSKTDSHGEIIDIAYVHKTASDDETLFPDQFETRKQLKSDLTAL